MFLWARQDDTRKRCGGGNKKAEVTYWNITEGIRKGSAKNVRKGSEGVGIELVHCM